MIFASEYFTLKGDQNSIKQSNKFLGVLVLLFTTLALAGCFGSSSGFDGTWESKDMGGLTIELDIVDDKTLEVTTSKGDQEVTQVFHIVAMDEKSLKASMASAER